MINAYREALAFDLPQMPAVILAGWWRWIDTARESPEDIMDALTAPLVRGTQYRVAPRSVAVLFARTAYASVLEESLSATPTASD
jgi:isoamylase